ncbi:cytochrome b [Halomonas faecis]|uniref:cytochrome b n=1 Tax=Halomonas faecis TaxID=1562110 RepID=UPI0013D3C2B9|nr:cytochrome b/b6 domain-containing protein [Halomonas faecis]
MVNHPHQPPVDGPLNHYAYVHRLLHWLIAVLVLYSLTSGMTLGSLGFEGSVDTFGRTATDTIYTLHKTSGVLILVLMVLRLVSRLTNGKPPYAVPLPTLHRLASTLVHALLYVLLLAMPVLGWLATAAGDFPVQFFAWNLPGLIGVDEALSETLFVWHGRVGVLILLLAALHIAAALYHWLIRKDGVMARMSLFRH